MSAVVDRRAVLPGAAVGTVVLAVAIAAYNVTDALADFGDESNAVFAFYLLVVVGWGAAGHVAASRRIDLPLTNGAVAAVASVVPLAVVALVIASDRSELVGALIAHAFVAATAGIVGGLVAARREGR